MGVVFSWSRHLNLDWSSRYDLYRVISDSILAVAFPDSARGLRFHSLLKPSLLRRLLYLVIFHPISESVFLFLDWNFQKLNSDSSINPSLSFDCELFLLRNSVSHLFFSARFRYWRRSVRRYLWISWLVFLKLWRFCSAAVLLFAFLRVGVWLFSISLLRIRILVLGRCLFLHFWRPWE